MSPCLQPRRALGSCAGWPDASHHDWFEGRGRKAVLFTAINDATSRSSVRFAATESTEATMALLRDYIGRFGRPVAPYADRASQFMTTRQASVEQQLQGLGAETQLQRALRELEIEYIRAHSPQANPCIESFIGKLRDESVKREIFANLCEAQAGVEAWRQEYNSERPHSSLGCLTPAEFARGWRAVARSVGSGRATASLRPQSEREAVTLSVYVDQ